MRGEFKISPCCFCVWCKSRELGGSGEGGGGVGSKIPLCSPSGGKLLLRPLRAVISYWIESHLESCQTSTSELFWENNQQL